MRRPCHRFLRASRGDRWIGFLLAAHLFSAPATAIELPPPPAGYSWEECEEIKGAILVPKGWHFRKVRREEGIAYFVTKEPFEPPETYEIGIGFNTIWDLPGKKGVAPSDFIREFLAHYLVKRKVESSWEGPPGPLFTRGLIFSEQEPTPRKFYNLLVGNDKTGTVYLVTFEAPADVWDKEWAVVETVLEILAFDDEV